MRIGIVDTTFSRVNMGAIALDEMKKYYPDVEIERRTVPGIKDLPVECKNALDDGCDVCLALGMVGGAPIDTQCGHEASIGIQQAKLMTKKHIIEVFVHENEAWSGKEFVSICQNRVRKHVHNAVKIVSDPDHLMQYAGRGLRQGKDDEGPIEEDSQSILGMVVSEFNSDITERMRNTAVNVAGRHGIGIRISSVPGVFDMPLVVKKMLSDKQVRAVVTLGAVVRGETAHDEVITKDAAKRLGELALEFNKPVTLGIIGHDVDRAMAEERAEEYAERSVNAALQLMKTMEE
jgi:riboflavin synthase